MKDNPAYFRMRLAEATVIEKHLEPFLLKSPVLSQEFRLSVCQYTECIEDNQFYNDDEFIDRVLVETVIPWCIFCHKIDGDKTLAELYRESHYTKLNSREQEFLEAAMHSYYSFYMVTEVNQGWGLTLKDLFLEKEYKVDEVDGTHSISIGDILYTKILNFDKTSMMFSTGAVPIGLLGLKDLQDFKKHVSAEGSGGSGGYEESDFFCEEDMSDEDFQELLLVLYLELACDVLSQAKQPLTMQNTDGELIVDHTITYKLSISPQQAFDKLSGLLFESTAEETLEDDGRFDKNGDLREITFSWLKKGNKIHKEWSNTVLGMITIKKGFLKINVNSKERCKKILARIKKFLGMDALLSDIKIMDVEQMMAFSSANKNLKPRRIEAPDIPVEIMDKILEECEDRWLSEKIPLLNNKTPKQALKLKNESQILEAMLLKMEDENHNSTAKIKGINAARLWQKLGI
ncbi:MAG: hypothetical protein WCN27_02550 [Alphaproteobacteria bacterium]